MNQRSQTGIYTKRVSDCLRPAPVAAQLDEACEVVVRRMADAAASAAVIVDADSRITGIVTEHDVMRKMAFQLPPETPVGRVMSQPVRSITEADYLYHGIARMRRRNLHHMPVVDQGGRPVGMLRLSDALAAANEAAMQQIDFLTAREPGVEGLAAIKRSQVDLAAQLFADGLPAPDIQGIITQINNDIIRQVVDAGVRGMEAAGRGAPPVPFGVLIMGSGGRGENFLYPDQDNGFVLDDYPDSDHTRIDGWFIELAERMTSDLAEIGFPLCNGNVMATNPIWRKTISQWKAQTSMWVRKRTPFAIRFSDIFFDFAWVCGERDLIADLRAHVGGITRKGHAFLQQLYQDDADDGVALGFFNRFITVKDQPDYKGQINMKHSGTMPLVQSLRLLALREGIGETSTMGRLAALHAAGVLDDDEADYLRGAFQHLTNLLLRRQVEDHRAGRKVANYVDPGKLSERERDMLVDSFKAIKSLHSRLRSEFTADVF